MIFNFTLHSIFKKYREFYYILTKDDNVQLLQAARPFLVSHDILPFASYNLSLGQKLKRLLSFIFPPLSKPPKSLTQIIKHQCCYYLVDLLSIPKVQYSHR
jgi:hypothetical protein